MSKTNIIIDMLTSISEMEKLGIYKVKQVNITSSYEDITYEYMLMLNKLKVKQLTPQIKCVIENSFHILDIIYPEWKNFN